MRSPRFDFNSDMEFKTFIYADRECFHLHAAVSID